jgi:hypothetical protein
VGWKQIVAVGLLTVAGCSRENRLYIDDVSSTGDTPETSASGETPPPGSSGGTTGAGVTSMPPPPEPTTDPTGLDTGTATTDGPLFDLGGYVCNGEVVVPCDPYDPLPCDEADRSCTPVTNELKGPGPHCVVAGQAELNEECQDACGPEAHKGCIAGLVCEPFPLTQGTCREPCTGSRDAPACDRGVCVQYDWFGVCVGECNPRLQDCGGGMSCALDANGVPVCVELMPVAGDDLDCSNQPCADGMICAPGDELVGCPGGGCCRQYCDATEVCDGMDEVCHLLEANNGTLTFGYCGPP